MRYTHKLYIIVLLVFFIAIAKSQLTNQQKEKLHPAFQSLLEALAKTNENHFSLRIRSVKVSENEEKYYAIIYTKNPEKIRELGVHTNSVFPDFVTALVTSGQLRQLALSELVTFIHPGSVIKSKLEVSRPEIGASLANAGFINNTSYKGKNIIVLIYDTGIDWKHLDFRKSDITKSRILAIWDQTLHAGLVGGSPPQNFDYGVEYSQAQIEDELDGRPANFIQSKDIVGHGTHVASIAAGNGLSYYGKYTGVAPEADIIVVKGVDGSFNEAAMIDGLSYAAQKATFYGKPVVINWSVGTQVGAHNGTSPDEAAVDNFVSSPGRVVCIAAGNEGENHIHISGTLNVADSVSIQIRVPPINGGQNQNSFIFDLWFEGSPWVVATITTPEGEKYSRTPGNMTNRFIFTNGELYLWNSQQGIEGNDNVELYVLYKPWYSTTGENWTLSLSSTQSPYTFHGWLAESNLDTGMVSLSDANTDYCIAMPGTSKGAITVDRKSVV
jgi:minor extracellular serine protease Vpr